jgi:hypothetical protein
VARQHDRRQEWQGNTTIKDHRGWRDRRREEEDETEREREEGWQREVN